MEEFDGNIYLVHNPDITKYPTHCANCIIPKRFASLLEYIDTSITGVTKSQNNSVK